MDIGFVSGDCFFVVFFFVYFFVCGICCVCGVQCEQYVQQEDDGCEWCELCCFVIYGFWSQQLYVECEWLCYELCDDELLQIWQQYGGCEV